MSVSDFIRCSSWMCAAAGSAVPETVVAPAAQLQGAQLHGGVERHQGLCGTGVGQLPRVRGRTPGLPPAGRPAAPLAVRLSCSNGSPIAAPGFYARRRDPPRGWYSGPSPPTRRARCVSSSIMPSVLRGCVRAPPRASDGQARGRAADRASRDDLQAEGLAWAARLARRPAAGGHPRPRPRRHHQHRGRGLGRGGAAGVDADEGGPGRLGPVTAAPPESLRTNDNGAAPEGTAPFEARRPQASVPGC